MSFESKLLIGIFYFKQSVKIDAGWKFKIMEQILIPRRNSYTEDSFLTKNFCSIEKMR